MTHTVRKRLAALCFSTLALAATATQAHAVENGVPAGVDNPVENAVTKVISGYRGCSGVMISPSWMLTAQHCVDGDKINSIHIGAHQENGSFQGTVHYNTEHPNSDMVLVNLNTVYTGKVARVTRDTPYGEASLVGFGKGNAVAQKAYLDIDQKVNKARQDSTKASYPYIKALPKQGNVRQGDSGGPLLVGDTVVGIFSHGPLNESTGIFSNAYSASVADSYDWIVNTTGVSYNEDGTAMDNGRDTSFNVPNNTPNTPPVHTDNPLSSMSSLSSLSSR